MRKLQKIILTLFVVFTAILVSVSSFAYTPTSSDKMIVKVVNQRVDEIKQENPSTILALTKILPIIQQKMQKEGNFRIAYIFGELYKHLKGINNVETDISVGENIVIENGEQNGENVSNHNLSRNRSDFQYVVCLGSLTFQTIFRSKIKFHEKV